MTLQSFSIPGRTSGALVALAALTMTACVVADDGTTSVASDTDTDPSGSASMTDTMSSADSTTVVTETTDPSETDTDTDTSDTATTGEHRVVECMAPGTMSWEGDVYIFRTEDMTLLDGYNTVTGDVKISEEAIDTLDFMACVTSIGGNLQVFGTTTTDVAGLANIETIGGSISISENANLTEVYGFDALTDVGGAFIVTKNPALTSVSGADAVQQIHLGLNIDENPVLTSITALSNTIAIGSTCMAGNCPDLSVSYNPELTNIDGLIGLAALGGQLLVTGNPKLCISKVQSLADMLQQWVEMGEGDTTGNKEDC